MCKKQLRKLKSLIENENVSCSPKTIALVQTCWPETWSNVACLFYQKYWSHTKQKEEVFFFYPKILHIFTNFSLKLTEYFVFYVLIHVKGQGSNYLWLEECRGHLPRLQFSFLVSVILMAQMGAGSRWMKPSGNTSTSILEKKKSGFNCVTFGECFCSVKE